MWQISAAACKAARRGRFIFLTASVTKDSGNYLDAKAAHITFLGVHLPPPACGDTLGRINRWGKAWCPTLSGAIDIGG